MISASGLVQYHWDMLCKHIKVLIRGEHRILPMDSDRTDQEVCVGALNSFPAAKVEVLCGSHIVFGQDRQVRKTRHVLRQAVKL